MKKILLIILFISFLSGCKEGQLVQSPPAKAFNNQQVVLTGYTENSIFLQAKGVATAEGVQDFHQLQFFVDANCQGPTIGELVASQLKDQGVPLHISMESEFKIYYQSSGVSGCHFAFDYQLHLDPVPVPKLDRTIPESPARTSTEIAVLGEVFPPQGHVKSILTHYVVKKLAKARMTSSNNPACRFKFHQTKSHL